MKIVISDCDHVDIDQETAIFQRKNIPFELHQCKTEEDLIQRCKGAEIILNQYAPLTRYVMEALRPELRQVVRYGVGVNNVDCNAATELGVQICNVPDYGMNEVADQAMALMLALVRKIPLMNSYTKTEKWDYSHATPIHRIPGQTVGIVGLGRIGKVFAKRMSGFDCRIIAFEPKYQPGTVVDHVEIVSFDELVEQADMISIHCPLLPETKGLFNLEVFRRMKSTAYIVNTSRGGIIDEGDLYEALKTGFIAGAGVDVVEKEPMELGCDLFALDNFLCTPHIAWYSEEATLELNRKAAEEAVRFAKGEEILYPVNSPKMKSNN